MIDFILYSIPWWIWAGFGLVAALVVARFFGLKPGMWALSLVVALILLMRARQAGFRDREDKLKQERADSVINRKRTDDEVDKMGESARDAEFDRWLRDKPR